MRLLRLLAVCLLYMNACSSCVYSLFGICCVLLLTNFPLAAHFYSLLVNMASCIGRLASQCPDIAAAAMPPYFFNWCRCIILIEVCQSALVRVSIVIGVCNLASCGCGLQSQKEWVDSIMGAACILAAAPMLGIQHFTAVCYSFVSVTSKSVNAGVTPPPELIAKIRM